jgi:hypothetical protein
MVKNANMTELRCLIMHAILIVTHFQPSSPLVQNGFVSGENCFVRNPLKKSLHAVVRSLPPLAARKFELAKLVMPGLVISRRYDNAPGTNRRGRDEMSENTLPAQPVDATQALNLSAGVSNCKVSRGRSFS